MSLRKKNFSVHKGLFDSFQAVVHNFGRRSQNLHCLCRGAVLSRKQHLDRELPDIKGLRRLMPKLLSIGLTIVQRVKEQLSASLYIPCEDGCSPLLQELDASWTSLFTVLDAAAVQKWTFYGEHAPLAMCMTESN